MRSPADVMSGAVSDGWLGPRSAQELFVLIVPAVFVFALTVFGERIVIDGDAFWHIAAGQWMIEHGAIIREDPFSYTFAGQPWHAHEWLSEVLMAATYRALGWNGLFLLAGLAFGATAYLLAQQLLKRLDPVPALYLGLFALANIKGWVMMRPHLFALPILVVWTGELLAAREEARAPRWFLVPLMVLWVNLHPSFLFGAALVAFFGLEATLSSADKFRTARAWSVSMLGILVATLVNPAGVSGAVFPLVFTITGTAAAIPEWQTSTFSELGPLEVTLLAALVVILFLGIRTTLARAILLAGLLHLTLAHQRFVIVLAIVGSMMLAEPVATALKARGWTAGSQTPINTSVASLGALVLAICIAAAALAIPRGLRNETISPVAALANVPKDIVEKPVFNDWLTGGYLILAGVQPFIDTRAELYGRDFIDSYLRIVRPETLPLKETLARHSVIWTLLPPENRANAVLDLLPEWCTTFADDAAVVHVRRDALTDNTRCLGDR